LPVRGRTVYSDHGPRLRTGCHSGGWDAHRASGGREATGRARLRRMMARHPPASRTLIRSVRGELLGPTLDAWWPILNPDNADTLSAFGRPGAVGCVILVTGRPESRDERSSPQAEPNLCDWRGARSDSLRSRRRRLVPFLPNGFACRGPDASDVASGARLRQTRRGARAVYQTTASTGSLSHRPHWRSEAWRNGHAGATSAC